MHSAVSELEGASNFRSLAGITTSDGTRRIRANVLLRSDELSRLSDEDWRTLTSKYNLTTICDLRRRDEVQGYETRAPDGVTVHWWPYDDEAVAAMAAMTGAIRSHVAALASADHDTIDRWVEKRYASYAHAIDLLPRHMAAVAQCVLHADGATLVHCSAGKDRTGLLVAVLLRCCGVSVDAVADDYCATSDMYAARPVPRSHLLPLLQRHGLEALPDRALQQFCVAPRHAILDAMRHLDATYGSVDNYLTATVGLLPDDLTRLRECLTEPVPQ
jgi:protein-tyrosine phosphatase